MVQLKWGATIGLMIDTLQHYLFKPTLYIPIIMACLVAIKRLSDTFIGGICARTLYRIIFHTHSTHFHQIWHPW